MLEKAPKHFDWMSEWKETNPNIKNNSRDYAKRNIENNKISQKQAHTEMRRKGNTLPLLPVMPLLPLLRFSGPAI